jgi:predicted peptidase
MKKNYNVDSDRIYLIGSSGGGYASILMAGRKPEIWAGVSAWVPISDIRAWWEQKDKSKGRDRKYAKHIEKSVGGSPDQNEKAARECVKRSAITYLQNASKVNLDINHGVHDGRKGSVPFTHSLFAFNKIVSEQDRIPVKNIEEFYKTQKLPQGMAKAKPDKLYGNKQPIFRKISDNTRLTIFEGGHEIVHKAALNWLAQQSKGKPAIWELKGEKELKTSDKESDSGK